MALKWRRGALILAVAACSAAHHPTVVDIRFPSTEGGARSLIDPAARLTVVEFFSAHCPCQAKHDERLRGLAARYRAQGVAFVAVDSEADATLARDRREAVRRHYPYGILVDPTGKAAAALRANYATYCVLIDSSGAILYQGGIDSDRNRLHADATPYLADAIADAVFGRPIRVPVAKSLGCSLMRE